MKAKMKTYIILVSTMLLGLGSCTKTIKDDLRDLQQKIDALKKKNAELIEKAGGVENLIGSDEPIIASTTFEGNDGLPIIIKDTFSFKGNSGYTHSMRPLPNGQIQVQIVRFGKPDEAESSYLTFKYDPITKKVTQPNVQHSWYDRDIYWNYAIYDPSVYNKGISMKANVEKFDTNTGEIKISFTCQADAEYTSSMDEWSPNPGKPMSTTLSFSGKLIKHAPLED